MDSEMTAEMANIDRHIEKDALGIWTHMQFREKQLHLKRQFLMGLASKGCLDQNVRSNAGNRLALPESFLRNDDLFYEDVKVLVERCYGGCNVETQQCKSPDGVQCVDLHNMSRTILTLVDDLSNNGLYNLAKLVTRGLVTVVKTRPKMKQVIIKSIKGIQSSLYSDDYRIKFQNELSQLLKSPKNFRQNYRKHVKMTLKSHHGDVKKVLDGLEAMKLPTLVAMYRKLKGIKNNRPQLDYCPARRPKKRLIKRVRQLSSGILKQLHESDELPEPLVKAMTVASLSSIVESGSQDLSEPKFLHATPEIKTVQDEIVKAILLLDQRVEKDQMKKLRHLLDPDSKAEGKFLKSAIRKLLTEFLFECIDMDAVPDCILGTLSLINKRLTHNTCRSLSKDLMNEDVECILNVSAYLKQLLLECNSSNQIDQDFVDAYMDETEEGDDGDIFDDSDDDQKRHANSMDESQSSDSSEQVGSTSYADDASFISPSSTREGNLGGVHEVVSSKLADDVCSDTETSCGEILFSTVTKGSSSIDLPELVNGCTKISRKKLFSSSTGLLNTDDNCLKQNIKSGCQRNQYVVIQEVCDNASVVAFQLIGQVLTILGQLEALSLDRDEESYLRGGDSSPGCFQDPAANSRDKDVSCSVVVEAVEKVLPSFSKSELEMVKKFMSS